MRLAKVTVLISYSGHMSGADLGFLEWWGRKYKHAQSVCKILKPRPLN